MFPESRAGRVAMKIDYDKYEGTFQDYWDTRLKSGELSMISAGFMNLLYDEALATWENSGRDELLARCREVEAQNEKMLMAMKMFVFDSHHKEDMACKCIRCKQGIMMESIIAEIEGER
jgi:hypothetical protein